jgi:hypothetical protein
MLASGGRNVHYPSDVLAPIVIGSALRGFSHWLATLHQQSGLRYAPESKELP